MMSTSTNSVPSNNAYPIKGSLGASEGMGPLLPQEENHHPSFLNEANQVEKSEYSTQSEITPQDSPIEGNLNPETLSHIISEIDGIFSNQILSLYQNLLHEGNINASHEGFTLLHYCIYMMSHISRPLPDKLQLFYLNDLCLTPPNPKEKGQRLLDLIEFILKNGANINSEDKYGRTPIYFASTLVDDELNRRFFELVQQFSSNDPSDSSSRMVSPLHVAASSINKDIVGLIKIVGEDVYALDKYERYPLHCATMHGLVHNVERLIYTHLN